MEKQDTKLYTLHVKDEIVRQGSEGNADVIKALSPTGQFAFQIHQAAPAVLAIPRTPERIVLSSSHP